MTVTHERQLEMTPSTQQLWLHWNSHISLSATPMLSVIQSVPSQKTKHINRNLEQCQEAWREKMKRKVMLLRKLWIVIPKLENPQCYLKNCRSCCDGLPLWLSCNCNWNHNYQQLFFNLLAATLILKDIGMFLQIVQQKQNKNHK